MIFRILRRLTTADAMGMTLVLLALLMFVHGISSSLRDTDVNDFVWFCLLALWISFGLGRIRLNGILTLIGMTMLGILLAWVLGARLARPLLELIQALISGIPQFVSAIRNGEPMDATLVVEAWNVIAQASSALWARLRDWIPNINAGGTIHDPLIRNIIWTLILWLCAAWMGWFAEQRSAVASFLPSMAALAAVTSYGERRFENLWVMVVLLLLLMGIWNYRNHTLQWLKKRIDYSDSIRVDNSQAVIFLALAIGALAFMAPSVSWRDIVEHLREDREAENEVAEMLGVQEPPAPAGTTRVQQPSLPRDHLLTGGIANSEQIVMTVRTGELPPVPDPSADVHAPRYYWRSTVYDRYVGTGWVTGAVSAQTVSADTPLIPGLPDGYRLVHLDVRMIEPEGRLFWSGMLFSADIPLKVNWRVRPPSDLFADQSALLQADLFAVSTDATDYRAESYVPAPTIDELRGAGAVYPEEIRVRYLQLPASLPGRVHDLARQITDGLIDPFERATAIEIYLRENYPYDLDVPPPPEGRDVADYFLFDLKKGYCDYYASAMVVLARSSGLPARFVSGYSPGTYDAAGAQYVIRELNAHSWAEVYFPGLGWIEFEPTASQPQIERVEEFLPILMDKDDKEAASDLLTRFRMERVFIWSSPLLIVLISAILYFAFLERWLVLRHSPEAAADVLYQRFYRAGRPLAGAWTRAETSSEFLHKLKASLLKIQDSTRFKRLPASIDAHATLLTSIHHASLFTRHTMRMQDAMTAWQIWKQLRGQLFLMRLLLKVVNVNDNNTQFNENKQA